jgi:hypothetical protein
MSIHGIKAFAVAGVAVAALGGGAFGVGVSASAPPTRAACVAPTSAAVSDLGIRHAELTQILTPAGTSLISSGSRGLVGLREALNEALGCVEESAGLPVPAVPAAAEAALQAGAVPRPESKSPNCRIV